MNIVTAVPRPYSLANARGLSELWYLRGRVTIKVFGEQTDYRFSQIETESPTGAQAPMHIHHREDETLLVLEGDVTVFAGTQRFDLSPGGFTFLPRGIAHAYYVRSASARWLATLSPAGFEQFFVEIGHPIEAGMARPQSIVPDPAELMRRLANYGVDVIGPSPSPS
ncbi:MAG: cupin domain-containing protein [Acidobacteriota bacterium]